MATAKADPQETSSDLPNELPQGLSNGRYRFDATERVQRLRLHALDRTTISMVEPELFWARAWMASAGEPWHIVRRGKATAGVLRGLTPVVDPDELLVGKFCPRELTAEEAEEVTRNGHSLVREIPRFVRVWSPGCRHGSGRL